MNPFKLIFGESIYKTNLRKYDRFLRLNTWKYFGKGLILLAIFVSFLRFTMAGKDGLDPNAFRVLIAFLISIGIYKIIASLMRYFRTTYPVYGTVNITKSDRRFRTGERVIGHRLKGVGREEIDRKQLQQHKSEQFAKFIYHMALVIVLLIVFWS